MRKLLLIPLALLFFVPHYASAARLFTNGWENNTVTAKLDQWNANTGSPTASSTQFRSGTFSGDIRSATAATAKGFGYVFNAADGNGPYFLRYYLRVTKVPNANTSISTFQAGVGPQEANIVLTTTGTLQLFRADGATQIGSASSALTLGQWYCVEVKIDKSPAGGSQIEQAYVDRDLGVAGTPYCGQTLFAGATNLTIATGVFNINIGTNWEGEGNTTGIWEFDDLALNDSTGSSQTGLPQDGKVIYLRPSAAGDANGFTTQTGGSAGATNNFGRMNETTPDGATTFNGATTLNLEDLYNMSDSGIGATDTVNVVSVNGYFRASATATTPTFKFEIEKAPAGTIAQSAAIHPVTTAFTTNELSSSGTNNSPIIEYKDPDGVSAWTQATLDTMQAGMKITTAGTTNRDDISTLWVIVDYNPAAVTPPPSGGGDAGAQVFFGDI